MSDFTKLPDNLEAPRDDGGASHLLGMLLPRTELPATDGTMVDLSQCKGITVLYAYPLTGRPGCALPGGWNDIPGARGCTPQACSFRNLSQELKSLGMDHLFGVSTQTTAYQKEAAERLQLPFPLLSDSRGELQALLDLPTFTADDEVLLKRLTVIAVEGRIEKVFYPVFPPDRNAEDVARWLRLRPDLH
ncbi:peroxiredoxin [Consotaella salsifontis]|uniref:Peroxiredoxin n=1 Tax=Consotaella salsifontis TaxID=1365950 RepID=A0A1T4T6E6_9HYPH|nr:peroxiredoxin [Consotaella salsifontis]SKA35983.1 Peroxiredoxin [Consotaella salsifontis]